MGGTVVVGEYLSWLGVLLTMAVPTFRSKSTAIDSSSAPDFTGDEPAGAAENDILLMHCEFDPNTLAAPQFDLPAGWSLLAQNANIADVNYSYMAWIRRGASTPSLAWTMPTGTLNHMIANLYCFTGVDTAHTVPFMDPVYLENALPIGGVITWDSVADVPTDSLVLLMNSWGGQGWTVHSLTNANLANLALIEYAQTNWGTDGSIFMWSGDYTGEPGAIGQTTGTPSGNAANYASWPHTLVLKGPDTSGWSVTIADGNGPLTALIAIADAKNGSHTATDFQGILNEIAGTSGLAPVGALAALGATSKELIGAINDLAGTSGEELLGAIQTWGATGG